MTNERKILVVDADPAVRQVVAESLYRNGFEVETARNGVDAIEKLMMDDYSGIVIDVMLNSVEGFDDVPFVRPQDVESLRIAVQENRFPVSGMPAWTILTRPFNLDYLVRQMSRNVETVEWEQ
jgi:DNA-binding response OmpR family regulator